MPETTWFAGKVNWNWSPEDGGFNELFKLQVRSIRDFCGLSRAGRGIEADGRWILYENLPHARTSVFIRVTEFTWLEFDRFGGELTPVFRLRFEVTEANRSRGRNNSSGYERGKSFYSDRFQMVFPSDYPRRPPEFRLDGVRGYGPSHEHHLNSGDWLCILAGSSDWHGTRDSAASGLGSAFDWAVWHHLNFTSKRRGFLSW